MTAARRDDPDLCRVCIQRPASADGVCDTCRPWYDDEPRWTWRDLEEALRQWRQRDVEAAVALAHRILCAQPRGQVAPAQPTSDSATHASTDDGGGGNRHPSADA